VNTAGWHFIRLRVLLFSHVAIPMPPDECRVDMLAAHVPVKTIAPRMVPKNTVPAIPTARMPAVLENVQSLDAGSIGHGRIVLAECSDTTSPTVALLEAFQWLGCPFMFSTLHRAYRVPFRE
jgi:hypothetical protein